MNTNEARKKGTFSRLRLSVSKRYLYPRSRKKMILLGVLGVVLFGVYFGGGWVVQGGRVLSSGPLSTHHAALESDCRRCHDRATRSISANCSGCHEPQTSKQRFFSFVAHYLYKSRDVERVKQAREKFRLQEQPCTACHPEHQGRNATIVVARDRTCTRCHALDSFEDDHPEFDFVQKPPYDEANLKFTHAMHVDLIRFDQSIPEDQLESICRQCHVLAEDGTHFKKLNFEEQCRDCHGPHRREQFQLLTARRSPCKVCHVLDGMDVASVQTDQRVFKRAVFPHSAHLPASRCLDCHNRIALTSEMKQAPAPDESATVNIPGIENCRQCHNSKLVAGTCVTCHAFHPNKELRFNLSAVGSP